MFTALGDASGGSSDVKLIPSTVMGGTKSEAERIVFDLLAQVPLPGGSPFIR